MRMLSWVLAAACGLGLASGAWAQIKIGQSAGFSGPVAAGVKDITDGAKLYFDAVNARGGVGGQKIELVSLDDKFDPNLTAANAEKLIHQGVLALFLTRGTPHAEAVLPLLAKHGLALVAPSSGAMLLHEPVIPHVFNVRATYQREAERAVQHLVSTGVSRIALLHVDDSFGNDAVMGGIKALHAGKMTAVVQLKFPRSKPELEPLIAQIIKAEAQAVLCIGASDATSASLKLLREHGSTAQFVTLSNNASAGVIKELGPLSRGVVISQVFPSERSLASPLVREARELAKSAGLVGVTPANLEGFAAAKLLVIALGKAGKDPTRASLLKALDSLGKVDLGGMDLSYSHNDHTGLDYVDLAIVGPDGKFWR